MKTIGKISQITRAPFVNMGIVSVLLGTAIAWYYCILHVEYFLLTLIAIIALHAGLNMSNDYFDHTSGADEINRQFNVCSGGSRTIQEGILSARQVIGIAGCLYLICISIGLYLAMVRGWPILWMGVAGVFLAYFYNATPIRLGYRGLGELAIGIGFGPLVVFGSFYVHTLHFSYEALWASLPIAWLMSATLLINEMPDCPADRVASKNTLVVILGPQRSVWVYVALVVLAYGAIIIGVLAGVLPYAALLALFALPLSYRAIRGSIQFHSDSIRLAPAQVATRRAYLIVAALLSLGYVVAKMLG